MIKAVFLKDSDAYYRGFSISGHAGYADSGKDIICAAVSTLSINTVNSIEAFTEDKFEASVDEKTGMLTCSFPEKISAESALLVDSLLLGLRGIEHDYTDHTYIKISIEEV